MPLCTRIRASCLPTYDQYCTLTQVSLQSTWNLGLHTVREQSGRGILWFHSVISEAKFLAHHLCQFQTLFSVKVVPQCDGKKPHSCEPCYLYLHLPAALILHEQPWHGCSKEGLMGHLDHLKTGTSKAKPTPALTEFEGFSTDFSKARNARGT